MAIADDILNLIIKGAKPGAKAGKSAGKGKLTAVRPPIAAPATGGRADPGMAVILGRAAEIGKKAKDRLKSTGEKFFDDSVEAYNRTMDIVPQEDFSGMYPRPADPSKMPLGGRMIPLTEAADEVSSELARRMAPGIGTNRQFFYRTGPMYEGMDRVGVDPQAFMERFGSTYGGTSPRTATVDNFLNASMLAYRAENGLPLDAPILGQGINDPGYGMIVNMHPGLTERLMSGANTFPTNPKPSSFKHNAKGNLKGITADTHNIRGSLISFDALYPGQIPRQWFHNDAAYRQYLDDGLSRELLSSKTGVNDSLASQTVRGDTSQVEYGPIADITRMAAEKAEVPFADGQSLGWFGMGEDTGLASPSNTIVDIGNDRLNITAQILGLPLDVVARLYGQGRIPVAGVAGAGLGAGLLADENEEGIR
jgi:hypothetical protein